jgi:hypothetical protein
METVLKTPLAYSQRLIAMVSVVRYNVIHVINMMDVFQP